MEQRDAVQLLWLLVRRVRAVEHDHALPGEPRVASELLREPLTLRHHEERRHGTADDDDLEVLGLRALAGGWSFETDDLW